MTIEYELPRYQESFIRRQYFPGTELPDPTFGSIDPTLIMPEREYHARELHTMTNGEFDCGLTWLYGKHLSLNTIDRPTGRFILGSDLLDWLERLKSDKAEQQRFWAMMGVIDHLSGHSDLERSFFDQVDDFLDGERVNGEIDVCTPTWDEGLSRYFCMTHGHICMCTSDPLFEQLHTPH